MVCSAASVLRTRAAEGGANVPLPKNLNNLAHTPNIPDLVLTPGQWNFVSCLISGSAGTDSRRLQIVLQSFEPGNRFYFDNLQLFECVERTDNR